MKNPDIFDYYKLNPTQVAWVETTRVALSLREKIGQLMHPMLTHYDATVPQEKLIRQVVDNQVGGAFLFCRSYRKLRELVAQVAPQMKVPLLLSGDYEAGANTIEEGLRFGSSMSLAAIADEAEGARLAYVAGRAAALQAHAVGARWSFAPVADINFNHDNPITNTRSYGDRVETIIRLSQAYVRGMQDHGMAACLKHFPGDGIDGRDQHLVTSSNRLSLEKWDETYGRTFRGGIEAGVYTIMMGHLTMPAFSSRDPQTGFGLPATLDRRIHEDLLRGRIGFKGLIISDAILMGGARYHAHSADELPMLNLAAGSDMVLFVDDVRAAIDEVERGLKRGQITEERIEEAVTRVLALKARLEVTEPLTLPDDATAEKVFDAGEFAADVTRAGELSLTCVRDIEKVYPLRLKPGSKIVLYQLPLETTDIPALLVGEQNDKNRPKLALHQELEARGYRVATVIEPQGYKREIADAQALVYIFVAGPQAGRGSIRLAQRATQFLDPDRIQSDFPSFFLSLGNPYLAWELSWMRNFVCAYSRGDNVQRAYARALLGEIPMTGRLPVTLPE
jgi:beta-N-acetylhexosaminidase